MPQIAEGNVRCSDNDQSSVRVVVPFTLTVCPKRIAVIVVFDVEIGKIGRHKRPCLTKNWGAWRRRERRLRRV